MENVNFYSALALYLYVEQIYIQHENKGKLYIFLDTLYREDIDLGRHR